MSMKTFLIIFAVLVLLGGGYYLFLNNHSENNNLPASSDGVSSPTENRDFSAYKLKDVSASGNEYYGKGVTGYTVLTTPITGSDHGWYSWQGTQVIWVQWQEAGSNKKVAYLVPGADPDTFEVYDYQAEYPGYAKDSVHVYLANVVVADADPQTFAPIKGCNQSAARDASNVWWTNAQGIPSHIGGVDASKVIITNCQVSQ